MPGRSGEAIAAVCALVAGCVHGAGGLPATTPGVAAAPALAPWRCDGAWGTNPVPDGRYFGTTFGCWRDASGADRDDPGDNCIPACLGEAIAAGLCPEGTPGPECERSIGWYAADAGRFGCLARLRVTDPATGRCAVVVALDRGPGCRVERLAGGAVLDLSHPASVHLMGGPAGAVERRVLVVAPADPDAPPGPCDAAARPRR